MRSCFSVAYKYDSKNLIVSLLSWKLTSILSPVLYFIIISYFTNRSFGLSSEYFLRKSIASVTVFAVDSCPCKGRIITRSINLDTDLESELKNSPTFFLFSFSNSFATPVLSFSLFQLSIFFLNFFSDVP
jgi:hypothetical protein